MYLESAHDNEAISNNSYLLDLIEAYNEIPPEEALHNILARSPENFATANEETQGLFEAAIGESLERHAAGTN